jgi:molybdate/tungstate transport system substrate-binding protein
VLDLGNLSIIHVPEIIETKGDTGLVIRGASIQLIALLESGDLDYAFEYESVIRQHDLQMVALPPELNLGETDYESNYAGVQVVLDFKRFSTVKPEFNGERIGYGITIPDNAPNPDGAAKFIAFLLGDEGRQIMGSNFHPLFDPATGDRYENIPPELQALCVAGDSP